jgi:peptidase M15-like protein
MELRYRRWLEGGAREQAAAYEAHLRASGLDRIIPIPELLRSGRRWKQCNADEFGLPPREYWSEIEPTLELVAELRAAKILADAHVASAWRNKAFNRCEGGSAHSRHLANNALDFDLGGDGADVDALCAYWRTHGAALHFGLGFYAPNRIHVDTSGFRTWGRDHHRGSSQCVSPSTGGTHHPSVVAN